MSNPTDEGALFVRVLTFASSDATGPVLDSGGLVLSIRPPVTISAEVPPYLLFCLGGDITGFDCSTATEPYSDIGVLKPSTTATAQTQLIAATNAEFGYTLWVLGNTMSSGNNVLPVMSGGVSKKGVSQFGMNLRANTSPIVGEDPVGPGSSAVSNNYNQQNQFYYNPGDTLVTAESADDIRKFTVSYVVNIADTQPGGIYTTTLTYAVLANF